MPRCSEDFPPSAFGSFCPPNFQLQALLSPPRRAGVAAEWGSLDLWTGRAFCNVFLKQTDQTPPSPSPAPPAKPIPFLYLTPLLISHPYRRHRCSQRLEIKILTQTRLVSASSKVQEFDFLNELRGRKVELLLRRHRARDLGADVGLIFIFTKCFLKE